MTTVRRIATLRLKVRNSASLLSAEIPLLNFAEYRGYPATAPLSTQKVARALMFERWNWELKPFQCLFSGFPSSDRLSNHVDGVLGDSLFNSSHRRLLPFPKSFGCWGIRVTLGYQLAQAITFTLCHDVTFVAPCMCNPPDKQR